MNVKMMLPDTIHVTQGTIITNFTYTEEYILDQEFKPTLGCHCSTCFHNCPCAQGQQILFDSKGRLIPLLNPNIISFDDTIFECNKSCSCQGQCLNSITSRSDIPKHKFTLRTTPDKGIAAYAANDISKGSYVCQYIGEIISFAEACRRQQQYDQDDDDDDIHALLYIREHLPSGNSVLRTQIDATRFGNISHFFNHSCDGGNLHLILLRHAYSLLPRIALFAKRDIKSGEELTFSYGMPHDGQATGAGNYHKKGKICRCNTKECKGYLPLDLLSN